MNKCLHCGDEVQNIAEEFCCIGCAAAYKIVNKFGFENYYKWREINPKERKIKPGEEEKIDITEFVLSKNNPYVPLTYGWGSPRPWGAARAALPYPEGIKAQNNEFEVNLIVQGLHCAACVWLIESILKRQENVVAARINLSKKTLFIRWKNNLALGNELAALIADIGYKLLPFDAEVLAQEEKKYDDKILRALAVAGFGVGNVMLFSFSLWFFDVEKMGIETRNLLHFFSALIALPVIAYSSRPFFSSAINSVKMGFPNMDLAISIAIFLACAVSLLEVFRSAHYVYFDSAVMLIFFLLIGRYLDLKARKKAFAIATEFSLLAASFGRVYDGDKIKILPAKDLHEGMVLLVAAGEKIAADGVIIEGEGEIDTSLITGEILPKNMKLNDEVFAGMINLSAPLKIKITKSSSNSLLSQIIALSSNIENKKNHYIRMADKLSKFYLPAVHILALITFVFWFRTGWEIALMNATAVLIITCPCALALAVPIVQTIAISNFIKRGILVKSGEALERLSEISTIIFDKTGSLTLGRPELKTSLMFSYDSQSEDNIFYLKLAASIAKKSRHPISQAIFNAYDGKLEELEVHEYQGLGLEAKFEDKIIKLGKKEFCQIKNNFSIPNNSLYCFMKIDEKEIVFILEDEIKNDAKQVIERLHQMGKKIILLSGDVKNNVALMAQELGIDEFYFEKTPIEKVEFLEKLKDQKVHFVMVGDGLNDAPALALADVSISFAKAADISQNIADIIIQNDKLIPIVDLIDSATRSINLMKQNLLIALVYNLIALPFAMMGHVVPLIAAIAMSSSSLLVLFNSFRMNK